MDRQHDISEFWGIWHAHNPLFIGDWMQAECFSMCAYGFWIGSIEFHSGISYSNPAWITTHDFIIEDHEPSLLKMLVFSIKDYIAVLSGTGSPAIGNLVPLHVPCSSPLAILIVPSWFGAFLYVFDKHTTFTYILPQTLKQFQMYTDRCFCAYMF